MKTKKKSLFMASCALAMATALFPSFSDKAQAAEKDIHLYKGIDVYANIEDAAPTGEKLTYDASKTDSTNVGVVLERWFKVTYTYPKNHPKRGQTIEKWVKKTTDELKSIYLPANQGRMSLATPTQYYNSPKDTAPEGTWQPINVGVNEQWMKVKLNHNGQEKWVKYTPETASKLYFSDLQQNLYLEKTTKAYPYIDNPLNFYPYAQQQVKVLNYSYRISTGAGVDRWIRYTADQKDKIFLSLDGKKLFASTTTDTYPNYIDNSPVYKYASQEFNIVERWYQIDTDKGHLWVKFGPGIDDSDLSAGKVMPMEPKTRYYDEWYWLGTANTFLSHFNKQEYSQEDLWFQARPDQMIERFGEKAGGTLEDVSSLLTQNGVPNSKVEKTVYPFTQIVKDTNSDEFTLASRKWTGEPQLTKSSVMTPIQGYLYQRGKQFVFMQDLQPGISEQYNGSQQQLVIPYEDLKKSSNLEWTETLTHIKK